MRLIRHHDDVTAVRKFRIPAAFDVGAELLDERKDVAVVFREQLLEVFGALGLNVLVFGRAAAFECLTDLLVELLAIRQNDESPVSVQFPQDLLGKEDHRK